MSPPGVFNEYSGAKYLIYAFSGISARKIGSLYISGARKE